MQQVRIPFLTNRPRIQKTTGYFSMIINRFIPHAKAASLTTLILALIFFAFLVPRILYSAPSYQSFLILPSPQMDKFILNVDLVKSNRFYIYEVITALFLHQSYLHFIGNMVFAVFIMYELEYCWRPSLLIGLCAGITSHFMAVLIGQGRYLGFSGALSGYFAIYLVTLIINCPYLHQQYPTQLPFTIILAVFMSFMIIGSGNGAVMHLFGFLAGMLYGAAFYPSDPDMSILSSFVELCLKFVSAFVFVGLGVAALIVA